MTILSDDLFSKLFQNMLVGNVTYIMLTLLFVNHTDMGSSFLKLFGDTKSDTLCTSRHDGYFILEPFHLLFTLQIVHRPPC